MPDHVSNPAELVRIEAAALELLAQRLDGPLRESFERVAELLAKTVRARHRAIITGIGKSGLVARKIAATFRATGTPAHFLHPAEALHGDLGILTAGDVLIALSYSGETEELLKLLPAIPRIGVTLVSFTGSLDSTLASASTHVLDVSIDREACAHQLSPTASTTAMLALGDALAIDVMQRLDFKPRDFADLHPGGQLGRRLATARQLMHAGMALPSVPPSAAMPQIMHEMSAKRLGMTTIQANGKLLGILSDGDLRRLLEHNGPRAFHKKAADIMNPNPRTITPETLAVDALLILEQHKITSLIVTEDGTADTPLLGVLHLHDLWEVAPTTTKVPTFPEPTEEEIVAESDPAPTSEPETASDASPDAPGHIDPPSDDGRL
jgi:arabinose-5-phosphate isomerase